MARIIAFVSFIVGLGLFGAPAEATTCPAPSTLANGHTADANDILGVFGCIDSSFAPLSGPLFTGNVGIGTATPGYALDVYGTIRASQISVNTAPAGESALTLNSDISFASNDGMYSNAYYFGGFKYMANGYGGLIYLASGDGSWQFLTAPSNSSGAGASASLTTRLYIANAGNVGIGTTSPAVALHVVGTIRQTNCTTAGTLSADTSGDIICSSDARRKNILGSYTTGLDALSRITPQLFIYKPTATDPVETFVHAGFIAQNVMSVIPQATALQRDGYYSLDTTPILAATVNSVKQLKALADRQAEEIGQLKARLADTDRRVANADRSQISSMDELRAEVAALKRAAHRRTSQIKTASR